MQFKVRLNNRASDPAEPVLCASRTTLAAISTRSAARRCSCGLAAT